FCAHDDSRARWSYREYFFARGEERAAQRCRLCGLEVGAERIELLRCRGVTSAQNQSFRGLPGVGEYRIEPPCGKRSEQNAAARRRRPRSCDAGDAGAAIFCQRGFIPADAKTVKRCQIKNFRLKILDFRLKTKSGGGCLDLKSTI